MHNRSFKTFSAAAMLFFFLATPIGAFAQLNQDQSRRLVQLLILKESGAISAEDAQTLFILQQLQNQQQNQNPGQQQNPGVGNNNGIAQGLLLGGVLNGGRQQGQFGGANGGQGALGQVGQTLSLLGMLGGNMGLTMVGMLMSMLGGITGGATPQKGNVDEQYVGQGQGFGSGRGPNSNYGAYDPYYTAPTTPSGTTAQAACTSSIFIVKDTTVTPNTTKPYPDTTSVAKNGCVLAINSDTVPHNVKVEVKKEGQTTVAANEAIAASSSHIFRFSTKNTYTLCVDSVATACTKVTVQ